MRLNSVARILAVLSILTVSYQNCGSKLNSKFLNQSSLVSSEQLNIANSESLTSFLGECAGLSAEEIAQRNGPQVTKPFAMDEFDSDHPWVQGNINHWVGGVSFSFPATISPDITVTGCNAFIQPSPGFAQVLIAYDESLPQDRTCEISVTCGGAQQNFNFTLARPPDTVPNPIVDARCETTDAICKSIDPNFYFEASTCSCRNRPPENRSGETTQSPPPSNPNPDTGTDLPDHCALPSMRNAPSCVAAREQESSPTNPAPECKTTDADCKAMNPGFRLDETHCSCTNM